MKKIMSRKIYDKLINRKERLLKSINEINEKINDVEVVDTYLKRDIHIKMMDRLILIFELKQQEMKIKEIAFKLGLSPQNTSMLYRKSLRYNRRGRLYHTKGVSNLCIYLQGGGE